MLAILALPVLVFSQLAVAHPSEVALRDLEKLYDLLAAEKRTLEEAPVEMSKRKKDGNSNTIEKCEQPPLELGLIIDSSVSIDKGDYVKGLHFLSNFLSDYMIQPDKVRVAAVSFGKGVYTQDGFNLTTYTEEDDVLSHVRNMPFRQGRSTDTGEALLHMREVQMNDAMTRPGVPKIVLVLTDGNSQRRYNTSDEALLTKEANITVVAVGVGRSVKYRELLNIAGGVPENVIQKASYDELDDEFKKTLISKTCIMVPKPTTTAPPTTTMQATEPCGKDFPTDVNFVFSPSALGLEQTSHVTRFIHHVMENEKLQEGVQYGLVTGDCPIDEGFTLNQYSNMVNVDEHLRNYDHNKLPELITKTTVERFETSSGGQKDARKVAVIFVGSSKKDTSKLKKSIEEMVFSKVKVYIATKDWDVRNSLSRLGLPSEVTFLTPGDSSFDQAVEMINDLCEPVMLG